MSWKSFFSFERMVTPMIIKVIFWIGFIGSLIGGAVIFFGGIITGISNSEFGTIVGGLFGGPIAAVLGILAVRIYCELLILFFRINETLTDIKKILLTKKVE